MTSVALDAEEELSRKARSLPPEERIGLAEELLSSVQDPHEEIEAAWGDELKRRANEVEGGTAKLIRLKKSSPKFVTSWSDQTAG